MGLSELFTAGVTAEEAYRLLVEGSPIPVWILSTSRIAYINDAGLRLLGASTPEEVVGRSPFEFIHPRSHHHVRERINLVNSGDLTDVGVLEEEFMRLDGTLVPVSVTAAVFPYNGGN